MFGKPVEFQGVPTVMEFRLSTLLSEDRPDQVFQVELLGYVHHELKATVGWFSPTGNNIARDACIAAPEEVG